MKKQPMMDMSRNFMKVYGAYTIENRAIADQRDGLKPVHRRILWAMLRGGYYAAPSKTHKTARLVGDVIGKYHPHGDMAVADAIVGMTSSHTKVPTVDGRGNWGNLFDSAADKRYTELRLTHYAQQVLLDKDMLSFVPMIDNYDGTEKEPLYLPARLPHLLFAGVSGIAVGATTNIPPLKPDGIIKLLAIALKRKIDVEDCLKYCKFNYRYGSTVVSSKKELKSLWKTGIGSIQFVCDLNIKGKIIYVSGAMPYFNWDSLYKRLMSLEGVKQVISSLSEKDGLTIQIRCSSEPSDKLFKNVQRVLSCRVQYDFNVVMRKLSDHPDKDYDWKFSSPSFIDYINQWVEWRKSMENKKLDLLIQRTIDEEKKQTLLQRAQQNIERLAKLLKSAKEKSSLLKAIQKLLKCSEDEAGMVLEFTLMRLSRLNAKDIQDRIKALQSERNHIKKLKNNITSYLQSCFEADGKLISAP